MRFRAEAFLRDTDDLAANLGHWESKRNAQAACMAHARELMTWDQPWSGIWQASSNAHWYQIVASLN